MGISGMVLSLLTVTVIVTVIVIVIVFISFFTEHLAICLC